MAERSSDLRSDVAVLQRRWRVIAAAVVLGVGLGVLYAYLVPVPLTSRSLVLLSNGASSGGDGSDPAVDTQVQIVLSTPVLAQAGRSMHPALSATEVLKRIDVQPTTSQLLQIDASSPRAEEAQALSQAVADAYVQRTTDNVRSVTGAIVSDLRTRRDSLAAQVKALQTQMNATAERLATEDRKSPVGIRDAQLQAQLQAEQADIAKQLDSVKSELAASGAVGSASTVASIVQSAAPATGPGRLFGLLTGGAIGGILVGVLAAALLALRARRDPRLRARDDMADAVASSVLADVRSRRQRSVAEWLALFETYVAPPVDAWAFRQLLRALGSMTDATSAQRERIGTTRSARIDHPRSIAVVTIAGDVRGLAVAPQLAAFAASLGVTTRFVLASNHDTAASMWAACSAERGAQPRPGLRIEVRPEGLPPPDRLPSSAPGSFDELITGEAGGAGRSENEPAADPDGLVSTLDGLLSAVDEALTPDAAVEDDEDDDEGVDNADATETSGGTPADASRVDDEGDEAGDHDAREADDETGDLHARTSEDEQSAGPRPGASIPEPATPAAEPLPTEPLPLLYPVPRHPAADLTVVLVVADPQEPSLDGVAPTEVTVLAIAPGVSTREQLARLAVAVDEAGRRIDGIVIADPDPSDRTTGRRTLDERARQTPLPMRVTGIGSTPVAISERGTGR